MFLVVDCPLLLFVVAAAVALTGRALAVVVGARFPMPGAVGFAVLLLLLLLLLAGEEGEEEEEEDDW